MKSRIGIVEYLNARPLTDRIDRDRFEVVADHPAATLLAIEREFTDEGVIERIRVIPKKDEGSHAKIWSVVEDEV